MTESISPFVRFGVLGMGEHARNLLPSFAKTKFSRLSAVASTARKKLDALKEKFPHVELCEGYDALLTHPEVDAVLLCLPNHLHYPWAKQLLLSGKHVLCEKPLSENETQAKDLQEIATRSGKCLREAFYYREHPQHSAAQELIKAGRIGEIRKIRVRYSFTIEESSGNYRLRPENGGGALLDVGCYGIDCSRLYFQDEPLSASGSMSIHPNLGIDLSSDFVLQFPGDRTAEISVAMNGPRENSLCIEGTKGRILLSQAFHVKPDQKVSLRIETTGSPAEQIAQPRDDQYATFFDKFALLSSGRIVEGEARIENGLANMQVVQLVRNSTTQHAFQ